MILIADGGSTKTSWCAIDAGGRQIYFNTEGYNPYFVEEEYIQRSLLAGLPPDITRDSVKEVFYYGAGCSDDKGKIILQAMKAVFPHSISEVHLDLLASARAVLGSNPGFAAILGTGTNSCLYDGKEIIMRIDSLGFILGDEGSGGYIGKKLLGDYIRGYMPEKISKDFWDTYHLTGDEIVDQILTKPMANRFCADFCKFVSENIEVDYFYQLVKLSFGDFFRNLVCGYPNYKDYSFNCVGSLAYNFKNILEEVAVEFGMKMGRVIQAPINDLVKYHVDIAASQPNR